MQSNPIRSLKAILFLRRNWPRGYAPLIAGLYGKTSVESGRKGWEAYWDAQTVPLARALGGVVDPNSTTYEFIIDRLIRGEKLPPLDDPQFHYIMRLEARDTANRFLPVSASIILSKGQTLGSTHLFTTGINIVWCGIFLEKVVSSPQEEKPGGASPSLAETINAVLTSPEVGIINLTASAVTIITALIIVAKRWEKTHQARKASPPQRFPQPEKTDIYAIRLRWTDGRQRDTPQKWLTEPDELKHFINVFQEPSSQLKPTEVVFVLWNREIYVVDVTKGTQGNLQLDEMLKRLKIDSEKK